MMVDGTYFEIKSPMNMVSTLRPDTSSTEKGQEKRHYATRPYLYVI